MRRTVLLAALVTATLTVPAQWASASAPADVALTAATAAPSVSPDADQLDLTGVTSDWRIDRTADGRRQIVWGNNLSAFPVRGTVAAHGHGNVRDDTAPAVSTTGRTTAAGVTCALLVGNVYKVNSPLQADAQQSCFGPFGRQRISNKFQRTSWSGMRAFTGIGNTDWSYATEIYWVFSAPCNSSGGTYQYNLWAQGYADAIGLSPSQTSRNLSQNFKCGTGVS